MQDLRISLVQGDTRWHDPAGNRDYYGAADRAAARHHRPDPAAGNLHQRLHQRGHRPGRDAWTARPSPGCANSRAGSARRSPAACRSATATASFNRLLFATPDGALQHYDKRHLFRYAKEHERYAAGRERLTVEWKGWRICPLVCYDLRFPVYLAQPLRRRAPGRPRLRPAAVRRQLAGGARAIRGRRCCARARSRTCASSPASTASAPTATACTIPATAR